MTLTAALRAALADSPDLEPLRQIAAQDEPNDVRAARQALLAHVLLAGFDFRHLNGRFIAAAPAIVFTLLSGGGNLDDLRLVTMEPAVAPELPRSAEWTAAALRLAAWVDGEVR